MSGSTMAMSQWLKNLQYKLTLGVSYAVHWALESRLLRPGWEALPTAFGLPLLLPNGKEIAKGKNIRKRQLKSKGKIIVFLLTKGKRQTVPLHLLIHSFIIKLSTSVISITIRYHTCLDKDINVLLPLHWRLSCPVSSWK